MRQTRKKGNKLYVYKGGLTVDGVAHGLGTYTTWNMKTGDKIKSCEYIGDWKDGKQHGDGVYTIFSYRERLKGCGFKEYIIICISKGKWHEGEFVEGTKKCENGVLCEGKWHDEGFTGNIKYKGRRLSYISYSGECNHDEERHGRGYMTYSKYEHYKGDWKDDKKHGKGGMTYSNGDHYEGDWKDDKQNGQGDMTYCNGNHYVGGWKDGNKHGQGFMTFKEGNTFKGSWKNDKMDQGDVLHKDGTHSGILNGRYLHVRTPNVTKNNL